MRVCVDRIEGVVAVLEVAGGTVDWPLSALPEGTAEGDVFEVAFERIPNVDQAAAIIEALGQSGPKGDIIDL